MTEHDDETVGNSQLIRDALDEIEKKAEKITLQLVKYDVGYLLELREHSDRVTQIAIDQILNQRFLSDQKEQVFTKKHMNYLLFFTAIVACSSAITVIIQLLAYID